MEDKELFQDLFEQSFPAVSSEIRARFRSFLCSDRTDYKWLFQDPGKELRQGDIVGMIPPFFWDGSNVKVAKQSCPAILIEHTCDMVFSEGNVRSEHYNFAPLFPLDLIRKSFPDPSALIKNFISHKIYFGNIAQLGAEYIADLNLISSIDGKALHSALDTGKMERFVSLTDTGYFFFLAKISSHLLRADRELKEAVGS